MITMLVAVLALSAVNIAYKAVGPALLGDRTFPPRVQAAVDAMPIAILAALLVVDFLGARWLDLDWTLLPGLAVAVALRAWGRSQLLCIIAGVAATALVRMLLAAG
jgi:branched-subunit amino acid transport protein